MLEFDAATKRFGCRRRRSTAARSPPGPGGSPASSGPNGAGKTTAMRAVFGLVELDGGAVRWRGAPVIGVPSGRGSATCPRSAACTRACGCATSSCTSAGCAGGRSHDVGRTVDTWLERLGLADRAADRLDALSHGNQQRVQLIAALVNEPELLVLDEPFSGLDPLAMGAMSELLAEVAAAGATVLFSSHQLDLVEDLCEDVVIIDHGRIVLAGDLDELRAAVPQRFVDIRYRGRAPGLVERCRRSRSSRRRDGRGPAAGRPRRRPRRDAWPPPSSTAELVSFAYQPPTLSELFREAVAA